MSIMRTVHTYLVLPVDRLRCFDLLSRTLARAFLLALAGLGLGLLVEQIKRLINNKYSVGIIQDKQTPNAGEIVCTSNQTILLFSSSFNLLAKSVAHILIIWKTM